MFRRFIVPFCLLFLCMGLVVQADAPPEEENQATSGQTEVTARVEPSENSPDVKTGDMNNSIVVLFLFLISSIVLMAGKVRSILKNVGRSQYQDVSKT